jgi:hypothetical protein
MEYLDAQALLRDELQHYSEYWDNTKTPYDNTISLLSQTVILPHPEIQLPLQAVALWLNTKWCKQLPIIFNYGEAGTGKSTTALIARSMHDSELLSASSTFASIRNAIKESRYLTPEDESEETDGAILAFDNVNSSTFDDEDVRNIFLMGNKRGTDLVTHAGKVGGGNVQFRCFCLKMMSSIFPIYTRPELSELLRRMVIIFHEKVEGKEIDLIDPEDIDFEGFYERVYFPFYQSKMNLAVFAKAWKSAKQLKYPAVWDMNRKALMRDVIATGVTIGAWATPSDAVKALSAYWELFDQKIKDTSTDFVQFLREWIDDRPAVSHPELATKIALWVTENRLIEKPKPIAISGAMAQMGYTKHKDIWMKRQ